MKNLKSASSIEMMIKEVSEFFAACDHLKLDFEVVANMINKRKAQAEADQDSIELIITNMMVHEHITRDMMEDDQDFAAAEYKA